MNKVSVEYRNKDGLLSNRADEPVEAIVEVSAVSINAHGNIDSINKEYHLYVGKIISIDELNREKIVSTEEINKLIAKGLVQFVRSEMGIMPLGSEDVVFEDSQMLLSRVNMMLAKLDSLGYETPGVLRKGSVR